MLDFLLPLHSDRSKASGLATSCVLGSVGFMLPPSGPLLAGTKPSGARACRSSAAIASTWLLSVVPFTPLSGLSGCCCVLASACDAMKLTSVL